MTRGNQSPFTTLSVEEYELHWAVLTGEREIDDELIRELEDLKEEC